MARGGFNILIKNLNKEQHLGNKVNTKEGPNKHYFYLGYASLGVEAFTSLVIKLAKWRLYYRKVIV